MNKAPGVDNIINEFLIISKDILIPILVKLFNVILESGKVPESWIRGIIIPIFKYKGETKDPGN